MPRIRYIKPEFFSDEDLAELHFETRLAFAGLWCYADKSGRLEDRPKFLKAMIFPYDDIDMEKQLQILNNPKKNGTAFIIRYEVKGLKLIQIVNWDKHQKPHHTERDSIFPPHPPFKGMGMEKQNEGSPELTNGEITVKQTLNLTSLLLNEIIRNKPDFKRPDLQTWAKEIDLMIRRDGRKPERIREVILWCQSNSFWWKNILSTRKLREKFDRLEAEMKEEKTKSTSKAAQRPRVEYKDLTGRRK